MLIPLPYPTTKDAVVSLRPTSSVASVMEEDREYELMYKELDRILSQQLLIPHYMPIVNSRERGIIGHEALIRGPATSPLHSPAKLFKTAQHCGRLMELELLCRELSVRRFKALNLPGKLFLNVSPATMLEADFKSGMTLSLMKKIGFDADRIVIEITEQFPIEDYVLMKDASQHYRELGFQVALDDLGAGYSGLRSWSELRPQYVKIDRHFIEGIESAPVKQEFVRSIQEVARSIQCQVIAEGIERPEEHLMLNGLDVVMQQGYYFGRPSPLPSSQLDNQLFRFGNGNINSNPGQRQDLTNITRIRPAIDSLTLMGVAARIFRRQPEINSLVVVDEDLPLGLLNRETFLSLYLNPFGRELNDTKPVTEFMDTNPLILDECTELIAVSSQIREIDPSTVRSDFIVTSHGRYLGTGSIIDLLKQVTDLQLRSARHANPLTLLPGNVPANEEMVRRMQKGETFAACYIDIDHFKAFNDHYGYERGDQMIRLLADCLKDQLDDSCDFLSHIGGDDFIVLFGSEDWQERCLNVLDGFTARVYDLYDDHERQLEGIRGVDRNGVNVHFPIASLSIGVTIPDLDRCRSYHDVSVLLKDAKKLAKKEPGNSLLVNRRREPDRLR